MYQSLVNSKMRAYTKVSNVIQALEVIFDSSTATARADAYELAEFILWEMNQCPSGPVYCCLQTLLRELKEELNS